MKAKLPGQSVRGLFDKLVVAYKAIKDLVMIVGIAILMWNSVTGLPIIKSLRNLPDSQDSVRKELHRYNDALANAAIIIDSNLPKTSTMHLVERRIDTSREMEHTLYSRIANVESKIKPWIN